MDEAAWRQVEAGKESSGRVEGNQGGCGDIGGKRATVTATEAWATTFGQRGDIRDKWAEETHWQRLWPAARQRLAGVPEVWSESGTARGGVAGGSGGRHGPCEEARPVATGASMTQGGATGGCGAVWGTWRLAGGGRRCSGLTCR
uniref:Uncharacterized protein n=1 Tax=Oryza punctata TaxID=4537 RepID=A0A0E0M7L0_ORYPU